MRVVLAVVAGVFVVFAVVSAIAAIHAAVAGSGIGALRYGSAAIAMLLIARAWLVVRRERARTGSLQATRAVAIWLAIGLVGLVGAMVVFAVTA